MITGSACHVAKASSSACQIAMDDASSACRAVVVGRRWLCGAAVLPFLQCRLLQYNLYALPCEPREPLQCAFCVCMQLCFMRKL